MIKQFKVDLLVFVQTQYEKEEGAKDSVLKCLSTAIDYLKGGSKSPWHVTDGIANTTPGFDDTDTNTYWCCINLVYGWEDYLRNATRKAAIWGKELDMFLLLYNVEESTEDQKLAYEYEHEEEMIKQHYYATR